MVTRGKGDLGLNPNKCSKPTIFIIAATIELYPEKYYTEGLRVNTVPTQRVSPAALSPAIKSLNYLNNILAKIEGNLYGAQESIMLNAQGFVAECTADNIFVDEEGQDPHAARLRRRAGRHHAPPDVRAGARDGPRDPGGQLTRYDLFVADELFCTGHGRRGGADQRGGWPQDRHGPRGPGDAGIHQELPTARRAAARQFIGYGDVFRLNARFPFLTK